MNAQSYAIQPGNFHNWEEERLYAREAALDSFVEDQYTDLASDARCKVYPRIDDLMADATTNLYDSPEKAEKFNRLLFALLAGSADCLREMRAMLDTEVRNVMESEFEATHH